MFKKALILLILSLTVYNFCAAQYTDDAKDKSDTTKSSSKNERLIDLKQNGLLGAEFMVTANRGVFFLEVSPFAGVKIKNSVVLGAGLHASTLIYDKPYFYYGGYTFARVSIVQGYFVQAEYRFLNGIVPGGTPPFDRKWVSSPIVGIGFMNGKSSWLLIGYAFNKDFQDINPFKSLVYRIGFYF